MITMLGWRRSLINLIGKLPCLSGASLYNDPNLMQRTSKVQIAAELAARYRIVDEYQHRPASLRSLKFLLSQALPNLKNRAKFIPNLRVPWWLILLTILRSPKI